MKYDAQTLNLIETIMFVPLIGWVAYQPMIVYISHICFSVAVVCKASSTKYKRDAH